MFFLGNRSAPRVSKRPQKEVDQDTEYTDIQERILSHKRLKLKSTSNDSCDDGDDNEGYILPSDSSISPCSKESDKSISDLSNLTLSHNSSHVNTSGASIIVKNGVHSNGNNRLYGAENSSVIVSPSKSEFMSSNRRSVTGLNIDNVGTNGSVISSTSLPLNSNLSSDESTLVSASKAYRSGDVFQVVQSPLPVDASSTSNDMLVDDVPSQVHKPCFLRCSLHLKQNESVISLEMNYIDGVGGKEAMNQLLQYMKNRMSQSF